MDSPHPKIAKIPSQMDDSFRFRDMDNLPKFGEILQNVQSHATRHFIVDFNAGKARVAFDLPEDAFTSIFKAGAPSNMARWINIWHPYRQRPLLNLISQRYGFSPRLSALMSSDPRISRKRSKMMRQPPQDYFAKQQRETVNARDLEKGDALSELSATPDQTPSPGLSNANLKNIYSLVEDIWHYTSVDMGKGYTCIGYNTLYGTKHPEQVCTDGPLPHCTRIWTWLILCDDGSVISVSEDPFPLVDGQFTPFQKRVIEDVRRNVFNIFCSLSKAKEASMLVNKPMALLPLRIPPSNGAEPANPVHLAGLLFYYLFESWQNGYNIVTRRENGYRDEIALIRQQMFEKPTLAHIDRLDTIGNELKVLKRHYTGYKRIIERLVEMQDDTQRIHNLPRSESHDSVNTIRPQPVQPQTPGVALGSAAKIRFRRLQDLIDLYALDELEEYIQQKESLVGMSFNLIALSENLCMERLTRVGLLITKVTILFMPVSFMTSYFGLQLKGTEYSVGEYWIAFAVILVCSWLVLLLFGVLSGSMETFGYVKRKFAGRGKKEVDMV
ncbi:hypothetical protein K470DRAFT_255722 [Piedraia hortae CBS 480.64]|uniref:Cora-domain-containing protein n=1 Tax=Piedraia hortae CBS 480.64 TaxID=1314780 RepID=A0A6A7C6E9_9PEZI|nr:hypothetical protein K470DRAFT_255722 [Piedraia hortae CBS 480.64]